MLAGENIGKFSCLDYLEEKTLAIGHHFAKFANVFCCQHFPLYSIKFIHTTLTFSTAHPLSCNSSSYKIISSKKCIFSGSFSFSMSILSLVSTTWLPFAVHTA